MKPGQGQDVGGSALGKIGPNGSAQKAFVAAQKGEQQGSGVVVFERDGFYGHFKGRGGAGDERRSVGWDEVQSGGKAAEYADAQEQGGDEKWSAISTCEEKEKREQGEDAVYGVGIREKRA